MDGKKLLNRIKEGCRRCGSGIHESKNCGWYKNHHQGPPCRPCGKATGYALFHKEEDCFQSPKQDGGRDRTILTPTPLGLLNQKTHKIIHPEQLNRLGSVRIRFYLPPPIFQHFICSKMRANPLIDEFFRNTMSSRVNPVFKNKNRKKRSMRKILSVERRCPFDNAQSYKKYLKDCKTSFYWL